MRHIHVEKKLSVYHNQTSLQRLLQNELCKEYVTCNKWKCIFNISICGFAQINKLGYRSVIENGRLLDRYRIATDTGCIVSNHIGFCCIGENPILCASLQIRQLFTSRIIQEIKGHSHPVTRHTRAI